MAIEALLDESAQLDVRIEIAKQHCVYKNRHIAYLNSEGEKLASEISNTTSQHTTSY